MRYNWDFTRLRNLAPLDGESKYSTDHGPVPLPSWMQGLAYQETRQLSPEEVRKCPYPHTGRDIYEVSNRVLPAGKTRIKAVYADLERRFPHGEEGPGFFFCEGARGVCLVYNPGFEMRTQWKRIFGVAEPMFTDCRRAPVGFRPWTTPTVFYNGTRDDWAPTDSLGAPHFGHTAVQTWIDWTYSMDCAGELVPDILKRLGPAAVAWECRVQPPAT